MIPSESRGLDPGPHSKRDRIYDPIRKKWVASTPEEKVRQAVLNYLLESLRVPPNLVGVEYSLAALKKGDFRRVDIVVWKPGRVLSGLEPWLLVECKAPSVPITESVADQVARYLSVARSRFLMVSNGMDSRYLEWENEGYRPIRALPFF